jgi:hypothetical protein
MTIMDKIVKIFGHGLTAFLVLSLIATAIILGAWFALWTLISTLTN